MNILICPSAHLPAEAFKGEISVTGCIDRHRPGSLGNGASDKSNGDILPTSCLFHCPFQSFVISHLNQGFFDHVSIIFRRKVHRVLFCLRGCCKTVPEIKDHGNLRECAGFLKFKPDLSGHIVILRPVCQIQFIYIFHAVGWYVHRERCP